MHILSLVYSFSLFLWIPIFNCVKTIDEFEDEAPFSQLPCIRLYTEKNSTFVSDLPAKTKLCIDISNIPSEVRFLVVEAHSQRHNITLSYVDANNSSEVSGSSSDFVEGTGIGLVSFLDARPIQRFWVFNSKTVEIKVSLSVVAYRVEDPIPGGCNMEFPVEISPFLKISLKHGFTIVEFQHANVGYGPYEPEPSCSDTVSYLSYSTYLYFLNENEFDEEEYFKGLSLMRDVESIKKHGHLLEPYALSPRTRMTFTSYKGQGVIYNIITRYNMNGTHYEAAYVPLATYGCSFDSEVDGCETLTGSFARFLALVMAFFGLFVAVRGHRFLSIEMGFFGFLASSLIAFILFTKYTSIPAPDRDVFTMLIGIGFGITWALVWYFFGIPVVSVLLAGFCLGFLLTSILFFTPIGNYDLLHNDFNYWMLFSCGVLIVPVVFLSTTRLLNILACSIVGVYCCVVAIDRYLGSSLSYIVLNVVKRAVVEDANAASNEVPFQKTDIVLCSFWGVLAAIASVVQIYCERGRPPFPPAPYGIRRRELELRRQRSRDRPPRYREIMQLPSDDDSPDEREPLIVDRMGYGTLNTN